MIKRNIYLIMLKGPRYNQVSAVLILLYTLLIILYSIPELHKVLHSTLDATLIAFGIFFTIEYLLRFYACNYDPSTKRLSWALKILSIVDLIAVTSFCLSFLIPYNFLFLRLLRLLRALPIHSNNSVSRSLKTLLTVLDKKRKELLACLILLLVLMIIASCAIHCFEHSAQPDKFSSIPEAMWWAIMTITTVGYGDVYPVTIGGKITAGFFALIGFGFIALPAGILSSAYIEEKRTKNNHTCPHCGINSDEEQLDIQTKKLASAKGGAMKDI